MAVLATKGRESKWRDPAEQRTSGWSEPGGCSRNSKESDGVGAACAGREVTRGQTRLSFESLVRTSTFILKEMGSQCKNLSRGVTCPGLCFSKITPAAVLRELTGGKGRSREACSEAVEVSQRKRRWPGQRASAEVGRSGQI